MRKIVSLAICIILSTLLGGVGRGLILAQTYSQKIVGYYKAVPQEKVFVHTDKSNYLAGDSIWFRGYIVNALTNRQSPLSYYLYVDLVDDNSTIVSHSMILTDSIGIFDNAISLSPKLPTGIYRIVAYTSYMRNFPQEKFFSKEIRITGITETKEVKDSKRANGANRTYKANGGNRTGVATPFSVSVMPEGGNLLAGVTQKVAFKAIGRDGYGKDVKVKVVDDKGTVYAEGESKHLGMGCVTIEATSEPLFLEATDAEGNSQRVQFPEALTTGIGIAAVQHGDYLIAHPISTPDMDLSKAMLVIHGSLNIAVGENLTGEDVKIPLSNLHEGVTLLSIVEKATNKILAERAVFIRNVKADIGRTKSGIASAQPEGSKARSLVKATITAPQGLYSLSVTDENSTITDTLQDNIVSSLLLSSDVKGYVEQPQYYFRNVTAKTDYDLDLLMLTQAWRRYDISDILNDVRPSNKYPIEQSQAIEGEVGGIWKKNMKAPSLLLMCRYPKITKILDLNESGHFAIEGLQFADSTEFLIAALNHKGKTSFMNLEIAEPDVPKHIMSATPNLFPTEEYMSASSFKLRKSHLRNMALVELPDLDVVGKKREKPINSYGIQPDKAYNADDENLKDCNTMEDLLISLNAKTTADESGRETFAGTVYVDDFPYDKEYVMDLMPQDFERVEYMRPHNAGNMVFSDSEGNYQQSVDYGVLIIKLKRGGMSTEKTGKNAFATKVIMPLGFKQDVEFYSPAYDTAEKKKDAATDIRTTIYWNPRIIIDETGKKEVEFYLPDNSAELHYDLQGLSKSGPISIIRN